MTDKGNTKSDEVDHTLGLDQPASSRMHLKTGISLVIVLVMITTGYYFFRPDKNAGIQYKTAPVTQGDLTITVTATGKLEPVNQVEVSTEVSGTIKSVEVDFNDQVTTGQILAQLDTEQLAAKLRQSQASLDLARARVKEAEATVIEMRSKHQRAVQLAKRNLSSQEEIETVEAALKRAEAVQISAQAQVTQARAQLDVDKTALQKAVIHSPINGIVLTRNVEPGQTVAATFQAPVLFTLAEDLTRMELHVDIDEADVGQVKNSQLASFTVDAYPEHHFSAKILKVHYAPLVVQDVVTYQATLSVDNSSLLLRPGMTATADIIIKQVKNATLVANTALRFNPPQAEPSPSVLSSILPGPRGQPGNQRKIILTEKTQQQVWILQNDTPVAIPVTIGASDGRMTEILSGELTLGSPLLVDMIRASR